MILSSSVFTASHLDNSALSFEMKAMPATAAAPGRKVDETYVEQETQVRMLRQIICELLRKNEELRSMFSPAPWA